MCKKYEVAAYYFPNYHYEKANESWHGKGWNEWELVKSATPRFEGHIQPKVPLWGYENEADPQVMERKIATAANHGITAFIFDWYWHKEGPFLSRCLEEGYLKAKNNDQLKFAIMWANHDWLEIHPATRYQPYPVRRKGAVSREVFEMATQHMIDTYFGHASYWKVDGKIYFSIYELMSLVEGLGGLEETKEALEKFRKRVRNAGLGEMHINAVVWGCETLPTNNTLTNPNEILKYLGIDSVTSYVWVHFMEFEGFPKTSYSKMREKCKGEHRRLGSQFGMRHLPNVTVGWDSSPRTVQTDKYDSVGYPYYPVYEGNTPEEFEKALQDVKEYMNEENYETKICTINAWNEWTEGSYLEPDIVNGLSYLEAIKRVFG